MDLADISLRLALALALGFVIGLERGWKERDEDEGGRTAGLRTFSLIGLMGGIFGLLSGPQGHLLLAAGFATLGLLLGAFMWREGERHQDFSATSLVAALLTFVLGALAVLGDMRVTAGAGVVAVALLAYKTQLHGFLQRMTWAELRSGLTLAAMTFIALPLLPDRPVDPWGVLNLHDTWLFTILIAAVSFAGYAAAKLVGPKRGLVLAAALGGLITSTAVTLSLARLAKTNPGQLRLLAGAIVTSGAVMVVRVLVIAGIINLPLAIALAPVVLAGAAVMAFSAFIFTRGKAPGGPGRSNTLTHKNPFLLPEVLRFGAILAAVTVAVALAKRYWGDAGLLAVAALSGLGDVDAITLSVAKSGSADVAAAGAILLTIAVNTLAKSVYAWIAGGRRLGLMLLAQNAATIAAAGLVFRLLP